MILAGVDLAWQSENNPSAIASGRIVDNVLTINMIQSAVYGIDSILEILLGIAQLSGIAIDASLIINNKSGMRTCEKEIGSLYGARGAACHASNTTLYPKADSVYLSSQLINAGFNHLKGKQWQIECYPHPALIEIFALSYRLKYKKGKVTEKKAGQKQLAASLGKLQNSNILRLILNDQACQILNESKIDSLKGQSLKSNEDALDAIICLYIAGLYAIKYHGQIFGNLSSGYIWVPSGPCLGARN